MIKKLKMRKIKVSKSHICYKCNRMIRKGQTAYTVAGGSTKRFICEIRGEKMLGFSFIELVPHL